MRTDKEIVFILQTMIEVSLVTLPNFAGEAAMKDFKNAGNEVTDIDFGDPKQF